MTIEAVDGKKIIVATIRPGMAKPYYLRKEGMMEDTNIRVAGVTSKADPDRIQLHYLCLHAEIFDRQSFLLIITHFEIIRDCYLILAILMNIPPRECTKTGQIEH